ncbi:hypothetical protein ACFLT1_01745 [Bacteroidota bacterium]
METKKEIFIKVITFIIITSIISAGIFIWMFSGAKDSMGAVVIMMFIPGISAIITALIFKDKIANFGWRPGKVRYLLYSYLLPIAISLIGYGLIWLSDYADFSVKQVEKYKWAAMLGFDLPVPFIIGVLSNMIIVSSVTIVIFFG